MPAFGTVEPAQIPGGIAMLEGDPRAIEKAHRQMLDDRQSVPDELEAITTLSEETKVYIYSVGAWAQTVSLGSLGSHTIQGISEEHVLVPGDLTVSKPLVVQGIPSETYPVDDGGRRIYHRPQKNDPLRRHTGMHLALEIIGAGTKSKADNDLRPWGCFVSPFPEQKPDSPLFPKWRKLVEDAKSALAGKYAKIKAKANEAHKNGVYQKLYEGDDKLPIITRVTHATKAECPFMESMVTSVENKPCIACERLISATAIICACGQKQVSDKKYDEEIARRMKAANGEDAPAAKRRGRPPAPAKAEDPDEDRNVGRGRPRHSLAPSAEAVPLAPSGLPGSGSRPRP